MTLQQAVTLICDVWPFNRKNYPGISDPILGHVYHDEAVRHVAMHCVKDAGKMMAALEPRDHGRPVDLMMLKRTTRNLLVNALRMADVLTVDPEELVREYLDEIEANHS